MTDIKVEQHLISKDKQKDFMLAGKSRFTVANSETLNRFSFKVSKRKKKEETDTDIWFVSVDTNLANRKKITSTFQYNYLGYIVNNKYHYGIKKSKLGIDSDYNKVFSWLFKTVMNNTAPDKLQFFHNNHCARCGKTLRIPESIISGFGPECEKLMGLK